MSSHTFAVLSDIHYAGPEEQARGQDYEFRGLPNPVLRLLLRCHRRYFWLRNPLNQNHLLEQFISRAVGADLVIANGDYSCNTAFVGVSDHAALQSATECLGRLRRAFPRFEAVIGDHELGKFSFVGKRGGMRIASFMNATQNLGLRPFWRERIGRRVLLGVTSSVIALPVFESEVLPEELADWRELRREHVNQITSAFRQLKPGERVLLFCHDPTALPFLLECPEIAQRLSQVEQTIIGHLHSPLILWQSRVLAGMPRLGFLGHTGRRLSTALRRARDWRHFRVRLCPSLAGIELLKDGGFYSVEVDEEARAQARFTFHPLPRR